MKELLVVIELVADRRQTNMSVHAEECRQVYWQVKGVSSLSLFSRARVKTSMFDYFVDMFSHLLKSLPSSIRVGRWSSSLFSTNFSYRQNLVGDLSNVDLIDTPVSLHGWLQYRRMNSFGVLRDHSGFVQFILPSSMKEERQLLKQTPMESCLHITGVVRKRPERDINTQTNLGHLEVNPSSNSI